MRVFRATSTCSPAPPPTIPSLDEALSPRGPPPILFPILGAAWRTCGSIGRRRAIFAEAEKLLSFEGILSGVRNALEIGAAAAKHSAISVVALAISPDSSEKSELKTCPLLFAEKRSHERGSPELH